MVGVREHLADVGEEAHTDAGRGLLLGAEGERCKAATCRPVATGAVGDRKQDFPRVGRSIVQFIRNRYIRIKRYLGPVEGDSLGFA